ncbi:hypothetical protein Tco_1454655, partial [Tanacetum coccineum]
MALGSSRRRCQRWEDGVISLRKISSVCGKKGCGLMAHGVGNGIRLQRLRVGEFTVKDLSRMVEDKILHADSGAQETIWN